MPRFQRMIGTFVGRTGIGIVLMLTVMLVVTMFLTGGRTAHAASTTHPHLVAPNSAMSCSSVSIQASLVGSQVKVTLGISSSYSQTHLTANGNWFQMPDSGSFYGSSNTNSITTYFTPTPGAGMVYIGGWSNWNVYCYGDWSTSVFMP